VKKDGPQISQFKKKNIIRRFRRFRRLLKQKNTVLVLTSAVFFCSPEL